MKRRYKVLIGTVVILGVATVVLRLVLSHDSACVAGPPIAAGTPTMKGWVHRCYGGPEVMQYEDLAKPVAADDEVIVKVRAVSVNPLDWHVMRGKPYVMRLMGAGVGTPAEVELGVDFAGVVDSVGKNVTKFKPGDEVFGGRDGSFAEYLRVKENRNVVPKPASISFEQAAAIPIAAVTALQALRDAGSLKAGEKVLVNGASGGVGTYAVQIAKALGAEVTGVCSGRNVELVRSLGADHVIDYTKEDFTAGSAKYDLIVDAVVSHSLSDYRRVLPPGGRFVIIGSFSGGDYLGPLNEVLKAKAYDPFVSQSIAFMMASLTPEDLTKLRDMMVEGKIRSVIDRTYKMSELPEALRYLETNRARGKVVVSVE
ncbi:MAG TPA: NAD(P)-dependent alcohol dehydrogenase [Steroidobacteraceae bacterium]|jgi:NADPH:quinone reductase-like Zn-dependent oxidoreductase|nr:NAD(P)-dependent alcohol dehydrogenase [Steroidobacteraceae bacterium]